MCYVYFDASIRFIHIDFMNRIVSGATAISSVAALAKILMLHRNRYLLRDILDSLCNFEADTPRGKTVAKVIRGYEIAVLSIILSSNAKLGIDFKRPSPYFAQYADGGPFIRDYILYLLYGCLVLGVNVFVDTLFLFICSQICHKLHVISTTLTTVGPQAEQTKEESLVPFDESDEKKVTASIQEHIKMLHIIKRVEWLFNEIIFFQAFYTFGSLCLILFASSQTDKLAEDASRLFAMTISLSMELFLFCWAGEMIKSHCSDIHFASYNNGWYRCGKKIKKALMIIAIFASEPVTMKSAKLFHLTLHTYEAVVRETFSYYTLMYQFFNQK
ncbi:odorant receptor 4-like [Cimex lectularius]|uniref:Odorant receptor n=1 Tax=Cimex lectularius TaxID=79782 RepID=A0A8I6TMF0_CIMLE|nr:odorant receptor 4-like [Cimex lectularius]